MEPATPELPDYDNMNDEELNAELGLICSHMYAVDYRFLRCVRAWENVASLHVYGVKSTAHWLNARCGIAMGAAREKVRVARVLMVENGKGEPLSVGRLQRTVPWHIRKALMHRDGGCTFPGCTEQRYVDAHHIIHWADGGETSLANCTMLCRHHHRLVHEEGFGCERRDDGELIFTDPGGQVLSASFRLDPTSYTSLVDLHRRQKLGISAETALASTEWGHGMDMRMLMDCMISASHGPNFRYPMPGPVNWEEREARIARRQRVDAITRERFPLRRPDGTSPRKDPGDSSASDAA